MISMLYAESTIKNLSKNYIITMIAVAFFHSVLLSNATSKFYQLNIVVVPISRRQLVIFAYMVSKLVTNKHPKSKMVFSPPLVGVIFPPVFDACLYILRH